MTKVESMTSGLDTNPVYKRKYIPKGDGKRFRPLGVPSAPARVVNAMLTEFLTKVVNNSIGEDQYGFMVGRNILQA
jgi:retron-type reverse transcriptase